MSDTQAPSKERTNPSDDQVRALMQRYRFSYPIMSDLAGLIRDAWRQGQSAPEPEPALRPDGMPEPSLEVLKRIAARMRANAPDTAYIAEWAVEQIEEHNQSFDLRWKADMCAIKRWQEANPGNDLTWPDHADMVVWLLDQFDARAAQPPVTALREVIAERERQKSVEGWTPDHDDEHEGGALASAAACYAHHAQWQLRERKRGDQAPSITDPIVDALWPFDEEWWKPRDARRDLVRAAALILAEIERIDRHALTKSAEGQS